MIWEPFPFSWELSARVHYRASSWGVCREEDSDIVQLHSPHPQTSTASLTMQSGHSLRQALTHMEREREEKLGCFLHNLA